MNTRATKKNSHTGSKRFTWVRVKNGSFFTDTDRVAKMLKDLKSAEVETDKNGV